MYPHEASADPIRGWGEEGLRGEGSGLGVMRILQSGRRPVSNIVKLNF